MNLIALTIPTGKDCGLLIADLFRYCYERDFMSNLQKPKRFDIIDKFNDTCRYRDDIFTIDNLKFVEHIPYIYQRELWFNKANTSDKEKFFLDLNTCIKVIGSNKTPAFTTNAMTKMDSLQLNSPGWVAMFPYSRHTVFIFRC